MANIPSREELIAHLVRHRIAGDIATPRDNSLRNYRRLAERDPGVTFGMTFTKPWSAGDVLAMMAERVGVSRDPSYLTGSDRIDPEATTAALDRLADRIGAAAAGREPVLLATGHPAGLLTVYQALAFALVSAGCLVLQPAAGERVSVPDHRQAGEIRYVGGVAMFGIHASLRHTHAPEPMGRLLAEAADPPGIVVADHGWAGAAGEAGLPVVGFGDSNDPALFAGESEAKINVAVPLDDNVLPHLYRPLIAYILDRADLRLGGYSLW